MKSENKTINNEKNYFIAITIADCNWQLGTKGME
jgi:hypothetical protein